MAHGPSGLVWDLVTLDHASPAYLRVAGAADKASAAVARNAKQMGGATARLAATGAALTKRLTLPITAAAAVGVVEAMKYQKALNTVQVVTDQTDAQMAATSKGLERVATQTGTSLEQLTDGLYMVEKGGFRGAKALAILRAAAEGAKAENVDLGTATGALTSIMASYGRALGNPIAAENLIIKGSGLAKTTMRDFADSLSNVVPVAASLHIKFADVAAAIATMTQHGETAQHATDNLRNLITNLAGQNNVASQAMQQLGINTVDLSKNLGKRGLVGSLDYVLARIAKFRGADGTVVVDTFKKAGLATASLNTMLGTFSGKLLDNSKGLLNGSESIAKYTRFAKSMGGQSGASAQQFLGLYKSAYGFSNLIRSGKGNVQSYASALQKMLGGLTGMNVALQLSGESAGTFHKDADMISKAARTAGGDVLGWSKTQNTLAVRVDKAKAALQVMAVEVGTALIPVVQKITDWVSKAVGWFEHLSGTQRKILGWSAVALAALGPVLALGAKFKLLRTGLLSFVETSTAKLSSLAGASAATSARMVTVARNFTRTLGGLGAGLLGAQFGGNNTQGWLTSILIGTAGGAAFGGPVGAAVGAVSSILFKAIGLWGDNGKAAQQFALQAQADLAAAKAAADDYATTLDSIHIKLTKATRDRATQRLIDSGDLQEVQSAGINPSLAVDAVMGKNGASGKLYKQLKLADTEGLFAGQKKSFNDLIKDFGLESQAVKKAAADRRLYNDANGKSRDLHTSLAKTLKANGKVLYLTNDVTKKYNSTVGNTSKSAVKFQGEVERASKIQGENSVAAQNNTHWVVANIKAIQDQASQSLATGRNAQKVADTYATQTSQLKKQLIAAGANKDAVDALFETYGKLPKDVKTKLDVNKATAVGKLTSVEAKVNAIYNLIKTTPTLDVNTTGAERKVKTLTNTLLTLYGLTATPAVNLPGGVPTGPSSLGQLATPPGQKNPVTHNVNTITVNQTINNPVPEKASRQGPAALRHAALSFAR